MSNRSPVLVVDDDPDIRQALTDTLAVDGYEAVEAADGHTALEYLRSHPQTRVVLLDWNMAPMNGPQFMAELAKEPALSGIPVVLITADAKASEKASGHRFVGYLKKPVDLDALFKLVGRYFQAE